jgi:lipoyl(octanoyl) transferase
MKQWRLYPSLSATMAFQMAVDEVLFRRYFLDREDSLPLLRFYYSSEPAISVGYTYRGPEPTNGGKPFCRRWTGGGRVDHGRDLMFSIAAYKTDDESFPSVRMSYLKIHESVKLAYETLGLRPRFYRCDEGLPKGSDCFQFPIATDLACGDHKIAGGAQKRTRGAFLHQESLVIPKGIDSKVLEQTIAAGMENIFKIKLDTANWKPDYFKEAEVLKQAKYENADFLYRKS